MKKFNKRIIMLVLLIIEIIVIALVLFLFYLKNNATNTTTNTTNTDHNINNNINNNLYLDYPSAKPIIYLYPEEETKLIVKLGNPDKLTCSYPQYIDEWNVTSYPDGTILDNKTNRKLYSLYWEGKDFSTTITKEGFVVKKENTIEFLEEKLNLLGLSYKEAEEFIIYWLPKLQESEYNYIRFSTMQELNDYMPLSFSTEPDTLIRIHMVFKHLDNYINVNEQVLSAPLRNGFVAVEWGGTEIK